MTDITQVAQTLNFQKVSKLPKKYKYVQSDNDMPPMSYTVADAQQNIETHTKDGYETKNTSNKGDVIMSGVNGEKYVVKMDKFLKLYQGRVGETVIPEQSPRLVARYTQPEQINFTAPWGESMVLKQGDYVVKDNDGYYRIAKDEYEQTYNTINEDIDRVLKLAGVNEQFMGVPLPDGLQLPRKTTIDKPYQTPAGTHRDTMKCKACDAMKHGEIEEPWYFRFCSSIYEVKMGSIKELPPINEDMDRMLKLAGLNEVSRGIKSGKPSGILLDKNAYERILKMLQKEIGQCDAIVHSGKIKVGNFNENPDGGYSIMIDAHDSNMAVYNMYGRTMDGYASLVGDVIYRDGPEEIKTEFKSSGDTIPECLLDAVRRLSTYITPISYQQSTINNQQ